MDVRLGAVGCDSAKWLGCVNERYVHAMMMVCSNFFNGVLKEHGQNHNHHKQNQIPP